MLGVRHVSLATAMVALAVALSCGGTPEDGEEPESPTPTAVRPRAERDRPVRVIDIDLRSCETGGDPGDLVVATAHERVAEQYVAPVEKALARAIEQGGSVYGWSPQGPVCVHLFSTDNGFLQGLEQLAGLSSTVAKEYQRYFGTVGVDLATGRDTVYANTIISRGPNWVPLLVTHEYFHIVQTHVGGTGGGPQSSFPTWFLEGLADWEAIKLQGDPGTGWLSVLVTDERSGRALPLSSLVAWEQWRPIERNSSPYYKARAAAMYLEELAGPQAGAKLLRVNSGRNIGDIQEFESNFRDIAGVTIAEFEAGLVPFIEQLASRTALPVASP